VNSDTGWPSAQLKAPAAICMVLPPSTTGEVLKAKSIVKLPFTTVAESAGVPLTVKSLAWTVVGSTDSLTLILKTVGWVNTTPGQEVVTEQGAGVGVGDGAAAQKISIEFASIGGETSPPASQILVVPSASVGKLRRGAPNAGTGEPVVHVFVPGS